MAVLQSGWDLQEDGGGGAGVVVDGLELLDVRVFLAGNSRSSWADSWDAIQLAAHAWTQACRYWAALRARAEATR